MDNTTIILLINASLTIIITMISTILLVFKLFKRLQIKSCCFSLSCDARTDTDTVNEDQTINTVPFPSSYNNTNDDINEVAINKYISNQKDGMLVNNI